MHSASITVSDINFAIKHRLPIKSSTGNVFIPIEIIDEYIRCHLKDDFSTLLTIPLANIVEIETPTNNAEVDLDLLFTKLGYE